MYVGRLVALASNHSKVRRKILAGLRGQAVFKKIIDDVEYYSAIPQFQNSMDDLTKSLDVAVASLSMFP